MSQLDAALNQVGVNLSGFNQFGSAVEQFSTQNLTAAALSEAAQIVQSSLLTQVAAGMGNVPVGSAGGLAFGGAGGTWEAIHYANDLIPHQPKFKFLFKVSFVGFGAQNFDYYVLRCDKPRVQFNHTDVNYYNFRTRVLTSTTFQPLTCTFYDEIGNTTNDMFAMYCKMVSGTAAGNWGIDKGFGIASSTKPYQQAYSTAREIVVEQIFANGLLSNRFRFKNPRVESFDFDDLNMEDNAGSLLTVTFSYDALSCETVGQSTINTWGSTDLLRGGGTSGPSAGGVSSVYEDGYMAPLSANGNGIGGGVNPRTPQGSAFYDALRGGIAALSELPPSLADLVSSGLGSLVNSISDGGEIFVDSGLDNISRDVAETLSSIQSGANLSFPPGTSFGTNFGVPGFSESLTVFPTSVPEGAEVFSTPGFSFGSVADSAPPFSFGSFP